MTQVRKPASRGKVAGLFPTQKFEWFGFHALPIFKKYSLY